MARQASIAVMGWSHARAIGASVQWLPRAARVRWAGLRDPRARHDLSPVRDPRGASNLLPEG